MKTETKSHEKLLRRYSLCCVTNMNGIVTTFLCRESKVWNEKASGWAARWTSQCFDTLPEARCHLGSRLSLPDILLRLIYASVSPAFPSLFSDLFPFSASTSCLFWLVSHPTGSSILPHFFLLSPSSCMKPELERERAPAMLFVSLHIQTSSCSFEFLKRQRYLTYLFIVYHKRFSFCLHSKITSQAEFKPRRLLNESSIGKLRKETHALLGFALIYFANLVPIEICFILICYKQIIHFRRLFVFDQYSLQLK